MKRYFSLLVLLAIMATGCGRQPSEKDLEVPPSLSSVVERASTVDFCTLVRNSGRYDRQVVRTKAMFFRDMENAYVYDRSCDQNAYVWVELDPAYTYSKAEVKKKFEQIYCSKPPCSNSKTVTIVGRFEGPSSGSYGHLDGYRYRLSIMRIEGVEEVASNAQPSK
jgi:hypothetical protein